MGRLNALGRLLGVALVAIWLPLLLGGMKSLRTRGRFGESEGLIVTGPYARVRHPLYAGLSMSTVGMGLVLGSRRLVFGGSVWLVVTRLWSIHEEVDLAEKFGPAYEAYRRETPAMIPRWDSSCVRGGTPADLVSRRYRRANGYRPPERIGEPAA